MGFMFSIFGMCLTILPFIIVSNYFLSRVSKKTRFDCHIKNVRDKKGNLGVLVAYFAKILFLFSIFLFGLLCVCQFENESILKILLVSFVLFLVLNFFDKNNEN